MATFVAAALLVATSVGVAACGGGSASPSSTTQARTSADRTPLPAGKEPSAISKAVCDGWAQNQMASALGVRAHVSTPTWQDHVYRCVWTYPDGSFSLSVKELSSWSETKDYFHDLGTTLGVAQSLRNLGQGAFQAKDGAVVVRKDWKVLTVDVAGLPAQFAVPPSPRNDIAVTIGDVILGCWAGD